MDAETRSGAPLGLAGRLARNFLHSKLTPPLVVTSILLGVFAVVLTPREEEPQIIVPMVAVMVGLPGGARRQGRIEPDPSKLRSYGLSLAQLVPALEAAQAQLPAGALVDGGRRVVVEAKGFALDAGELRRVLIAERAGRPVYLE